MQGLRCNSPRNYGASHRARRVAFPRYPSWEDRGAQFAPHATDLEGSRSDDAGRDEEENTD